MIRRCKEQDFQGMYAVINDAAQAYRGVIPADCWHEPYMSRQELRHEIAQGVVFWGHEEAGNLIGVMGIQHVRDVTLIRHAYVRTDHQRQGVGSQLLRHLMEQTTRPTLVGTWADAVWAIRFYKDRLLRKYWSIPDRQVETSVVLADERWFAAQQGHAEGS
ncbi:MAG: GNAT family acetyltransferase [Anaerolineae bacterium SM23_84]|nr:MAG: GNAT family acetyltransferase [Anaerolineae bacterium SM23_84]